MKPQKLPQQGLHQDLRRVVGKHLVSPWLRPVAGHTARAFATIHGHVEASTKPLILDSCCGAGDSTRYLALQFPDALVIGIDKSAQRLQHNQQLKVAPRVHAGINRVEVEVRDRERVQQRLEEEHRAEVGAVQD